MAAPTFEPDDTPPVVVIGGGVSGLAAAWAARCAGARVVLLEARDRVGGVVTTVQAGGYLVELGPTSMTETPTLAALVDSLALGEARQGTSPAARRRYVLRAGRLVPVPTTPAAFLVSPLLSPRGRLRALAEPLIRRRATDAGEESLAALVARRFGRELLDYLVDPFVGGVYAGDPAGLGASHAMRQVGELERRHGSVLVGAARAARAGGARPGMMSFRGGLRRLPDALAASLGGAVRLGARVAALARDAAGWVVDYEDAAGPHRVRAAAVVAATPAHALGDVAMPGSLADALAPLGDVPHAAVATVALGFRRSDLMHPLDGFGMLAPSRERCGVLGALFNSSLFDERAPAGEVLVTCFVGGTRAPGAAREDRDALVARALAAIGPLLGVRGSPTLVRTATWDRAIPQYAIGHGAVVEAAARAEREHLGLHLAGSWRRGVSLGDCVALGLEAGAAAAAEAGTVRLRTASIAESNPAIA